MTNRLNESTVEQAAMEWLQDLGYEVKNGSEIAPGESDAERSSFRDVLLLDRLRAAMTRLNPSIPAEALEDALRKVQQIDAGSLVQNNLAFHAMIRDGVPVEYRRSDRSIAGDRVPLVDFELVVNQFSITEGQKKRRPDLLIFVNGLPIGIIELKNVADEEATIWTAWGQLQTYKKDLPTLFQYNELMVVSDGTSARVGSLTANREWFKLWRNIAEP